MPNTVHNLGNSLPNNLNTKLGNNFENNLQKQHVTHITTDVLALPKRKPGLTMHRLFLVLMIMFTVLLALVLGLEYFFDLSSWRSQGSQYLCPGVMGSPHQIAVCIKG